MNCLDRYIFRSLLKGWLLVLVILTAVFSLFALVEELDHINGRYRVADAASFIAFTTPQRALDLAPVIALLGTLIALAGMAKHSELIAMRAAGVPLIRIVYSVAIPIGLLIITLVLVAEYVAAPLYQRAEVQRSIIRSGNVNLLDGNGLWSNNEMRYFNVKSLRLGRIPEGIDLYEFYPDGQLKISIHADYAKVKENREWTLINVRYKELVDGYLVTRSLEKLDMGPFWSSQELPALSLSSAGMSLTGLYRYGKYLSAIGQRSERFELAFWQKATIPLAAGTMVLLATPIGAGLGSQRSTAFGRRIAIGAIVGIAFYLGTQIIHTTGLLLELDTRLIALTPILVSLSASGFLLSRMR